MSDFVGVLLVATVTAFLFCILGVFAGAFGGWLVGLVFDETSAKVLAYFGLPFQMWEVGAALGFVGCFFRTSSASK